MVRVAPLRIRRRRPGPAPGFVVVWWAGDRSRGGSAGGVGPTREFTRSRRPPSTRNARSASRRGSIDSSAMVVRTARRARLAADRAETGQSGRQSGAIGAARRIASRTNGSSSISWWSVRRATSGSAEHGRSGRPLARSTLGSASSSDLRPEVATTSGRRQRLHVSARAVGHVAVDEQAAVRPGQVEPGPDRFGEDRRVGDRDLVDASAIRPARSRSRRRSSNTKSRADPTARRGGSRR